MKQKSDREKGIEAIIDLQATVGIIEPRDMAGKAWDAMSESDRRLTMTTWMEIC
jgi:hypothetical protein